jgi:hypothetical protein
LIVQANVEFKNILNCWMQRCCLKRRNDTQHNDAQHNNIQHKGLICDTQQNNIQHKGLKCDTQHKCNSALVSFSMIMICHYVEYRYAVCRILFMVTLNVIVLSVFMLNVIMLSVVMQNVTMLSVVAPFATKLVTVFSWTSNEKELLRLNMEPP